MTAETTSKSAQLPDGYTMRAPTWDDQPAAAALVIACEVDEYGETDETLQTLADYWRPMSLESDARIVLDASGKIVGYADQASYHRHQVRLPGRVSVHEGHRGRGIGSFLTQWAEERGRRRLSDRPDGAKVRIQFGCAAGNQEAIDLLTDHGYAHERSFQRMVIDFGGPPPGPAWPDGIQVRVYQKGPDDRATWLAVEEAFDDHWGNVRSSFEDWSRIFERGSFDPSLWFLAMAGDEIAGALLCSMRDDMAWVGSLSVRRPWRRNGLAVSLLHHSFGEFYRRGQRKAGLSVDSDSLTGAPRVYERAGMHADQHTVVYAKVLRDGAELSTETLDY